ncbi:20728_t:CDS:1, partial [Entrophospora sp. SA101]
AFGEKTEQIFTELKNENLICPLCEKSWKKKATLQEGFFRCPVDEITLPQGEIEKFTEYLLNDYVKKSIEIVEYQRNKYKSFQRELSIRIDFEPEILQKSLQEQIEKIK